MKSPASNKINQSLLTQFKNNNLHIKTTGCTYGRANRDCIWNKRYTHAEKSTHTEKCYKIWVTRAHHLSHTPGAISKCILRAWVRIKFIYSWHAYRIFSIILIYLPDVNNFKDSPCAKICEMFARKLACSSVYYIKRIYKKCANTQVNYTIYWNDDGGRYVKIIISINFQINLANNKVKHSYKCRVLFYVKSVIRHSSAIYFCYI